MGELREEACVCVDQSWRERPRESGGKGQVVATVKDVGAGWDHPPRIPPSHQSIIRRLYLEMEHSNSIQFDPKSIYKH